MVDEVGNKGFMGIILVGFLGIVVRLLWFIILCLILFIFGIVKGNFLIVSMVFEFNLDVLFFEF